jgi:predicted phosphodiesterase
MIQKKDFKMEKVKAILCSDLHLRDSIPLSRKDDYWNAQYDKIKFLKELQEEHNCPVYCAGDIFNKAKSSPFLESWCLDNLPEGIVGIPGQHDLLNHNIENFYKSSIGVLAASGFYTLFENPFEKMLQFNGVGLIHTFIQKPGDKQDKIIGGSTAKSLLKKYPKLKIIVTGDNHKTFMVKHEGRVLVNPGSMMRMKADQINHKPSVFLWYKKSNTVKQVFYPIKEDVFDLSHLERQEEKEERIEAFVEHLNTDYDVGLDFENNLERFFRKNKTKKAVQNKIWEATDG